MQPEEIIRRPIILTEKSTRLREKQNQVIFEVRQGANKIQIKRAVEQRPDDGYIVDSLGWAYYRIGNYEDAVKNLERAIDLLDFVAEIRRASFPAEFLLSDLRPFEQVEWVRDMTARMIVTPADQNPPRIALLDTGVNRGHPLHEPLMTLVLDLLRFHHHRHSPSTRSGTTAGMPGGLGREPKF